MATSRSRLLLHRIALVAFVALWVTGLVLRDLEAIAFSIAVLVGIFLLPIRKGLLGRLFLAVVFVDVAAWMLPAAISNVDHGDELVFVALPVGLAAVAVAGILAAVGLGSVWVPAAIGVLGVGAVSFSQIADSNAVRARTGDIAISTKNVRFSTSRLSAAEGEISVRVKNKDLFWHSFTIDKLDVDTWVPVGATRRATFKATPGEYRFYCAIPGHDSAGMDGVLIVRAVVPKE